MRTLLFICAVGMMAVFKGKVRTQYLDETKSYIPISPEKVTLIVDDRNEHKIAQNGEFSIEGIENGYHTVQVLHKDFYFVPILIIVNDNDVKAFTLTAKGTKESTLTYPVILTASNYISHVEVCC